MNGIKFFIFGFLSCLTLFIALYSFKFLRRDKVFYVKLKSDCLIEDVGKLKSGTMLRLDKGMDEGFSRYILYLNLKGVDVEATPNEKGIFPYWLSSDSSNK